MRLRGLLARDGVCNICFAHRYDRCCGLLHRQFGFEIPHITEDGRYGKNLSIALASINAILRFQVALNCDFVPLLGVADVVDGTS